MRVRFLGYPGKPFTFDVAGRPGWSGPIEPGEEREVPAALGEYLLTNGLFVPVGGVVASVSFGPTVDPEPAHAALEEPTEDKAVKSPKRKKSTIP